MKVYVLVKLTSNLSFLKFPIFANDYGTNYKNCGVFKTIKGSKKYAKKEDPDLPILSLPFNSKKTMEKMEVPCWCIQEFCLL